MPEPISDANHAARVLDLFSEARELPSGERADYLERACIGEAGLIEEVQSLLRYESPADGFLAKPVMGSGAALLAQEMGGGVEPGAMLGDYRIVSLLGSGGMGEVYLAEDTVHGRQVALKLIGSERAADVRGRHFRHERRVLAGLNHPSIARLYGSGVTPDGQAYLVMEYVEGERLDKYCQVRRLDIGARLALFRQVCAAVTHAHQNLVVHRDLKPANIRVTRTGEPKLLDFGIAKLLDTEGEPTRNETPTLTMGTMMTPEYASPEQLRREAITTASDVYSLGVVLYELLTGQRPYAHLKSRRPDELARAICEEEPPRPSTVAGQTPATATTTAAGQKSATLDQPVASRRQLEGDLDNIVAKALRKEPGRRYPSALALAEDIRRHGEGLPVTARKDTLGYRASKFVRRNTVGVVAAALVLLALVSGLVATAWQAHAAAQERDRARAAQARAELAQKQTQQAKDQADRLNAFLQNLLGSADPSKMGKDVKVAQVLDAAGEKIDHDLAGEPEILAQAHDTLRRVYNELGLFEPAERHARAALELVRHLHGEDGPATTHAELMLGNILNRRVRFKEAELPLRHALAIAVRQTAPDNVEIARILNQLSAVLENTDRLSEADGLLVEALDRMHTAHAESSVEYLQMLNSLGVLKLTKRDYDAATTVFRRVIEIYGRTSPGEPGVLMPQINLCICLFAKQNLAEMDEVVGRLERDSQRIAGEKSAFYGIAVAIHACGDFARHDYPAAIPRLRLALDILGPAFPASTLTVVQCRGLLGLSLTRTGHPDEGEPFLRQAFANGGSCDKVEFVHTFGNLETALGECLLAQGRHAEAEPLLLAGHDELKTRLGESHPQSIRVKSLLHNLYTTWNKPSEAARYIADGTSANTPSTR